MIKYIKYVYKCLLTKIISFIHINIVNIKG